jgi:hypothetical protein
MALYLLQYRTSAPTREAATALLETVGSATAVVGGEVIEAQITSDRRTAFVVVEHADEDALVAGLGGSDVAPPGISQVRLVGADLSDVKAARDRAEANFLVEWDFPAGLTMDAYLRRKREASPKYAEVPEVQFLRTYVCEDMTRCLCFYHAPDADAVRHAREIVGAPVSRLASLEAVANEVVAHARG